MYALASSGGKDSTLALYHAMQEGFKITHLFHIYNPDTSRVRFHGYRPDMVERQAELMGLVPVMMPTRSGMFDSDFMEALEEVKGTGLKGIVFGNIFLEEIRQFYELRVRKVNLEYHDILWKKDRGKLLRGFIGSGFKAIITSVWLKKLDRGYLGREIDPGFLEDIGKEDADVCGENGEYHSLVYDGPVFTKPLKHRIYGIHEEKDNVFLDIRPA
ncbi:diphthine--ammonia ligase [Candidatus Woesearchaeota archaeon]|nr:diphthine--ammonia ligase [Candidatus Woesearchaeota archaeon]